MSAEHLTFSEEEQKAFVEVLNEMEAGPSQSSNTGSSIVPPLLPCVGGPNIPVMREKLALLVSREKTKEVVGVQLSHEQVKRLSDKDVEKYIKRYEAWVGSKTTDSLIDSVITLVTKAVEMVVDIDDIKEYQKEVKEDYIINEELSKIAGSFSLFCGRGMALANGGFITAKHWKGLKYGGKTDAKPENFDWQPVHTTLAAGRDINGHPLKGIDEVPEFEHSKVTD